MIALARAFGVQSRPVIVAEIGGNHGGDLRLALDMVDAARAAGADAVKFQTYVLDRWIARESPSYADFQREALSFEQFRVIAQHCRDTGIVFFSTPFDEESADFLETLDVPAFKIASGDLTHLPLLRHVAAKGRLVLLATGASTSADVDTAVEAIRSVGGADPVLLHCTAAYPAPDEEADIGTIPAFRARYGTVVGFSDHTLGIEIALGAVALGADIVEKHFTTDRSLPGGDNEMSITPGELAALVAGSRRIAAAVGEGAKYVRPSERQLRPLLRRSLALRRALTEGETITRDDLLVLRPGTGMAPAEIDRVVGRKAARSLAAGQMLVASDLA